MNRRTFIKTSGSGIAVAGIIPLSFSFPEEGKKYFYQGRTAGYTDFRIIDEGLKINSIESFTRGSISVIKVTADNGSAGWGQLATYDADISAMVLHRKIAQYFLGKDPAKIDELSDRAIEANHKYPWSYISRALSGVDTAIWDMYGQITRKPVVELLGGKPKRQLVYGSSMRRDISPADEAQRVKMLQDKHGFKAFKIRIGSEQGRNRDASPNRTQEIVLLVRKTIGWDVDLLVDANSCYTPDRAIEVGKMLEQQKVYLYEEPCPWWEAEWTKEVTDALDTKVSGGEQDNDMAQWRRMIAMKAVDVIQPDPLYLGGITRTFRVAKMASDAGLLCVPHSANHALVTTFALHLLGAIPNAEKYLEFSIESEEGINKEAQACYEPHLKVTDGAVMIPSEPGWGIRIKNDWLQKAEYQKSSI